MSVCPLQYFLIVQVDGVGSCGGDSGGPLLFKNYEEVEYWEQIAVIQGGDGNACGSIPGIYTRVDDPIVFDWMQEVLYASDPCDPSPCGPGARCMTNGNGNAICR